MLGKQEPQRSMFQLVDIEDLVPEDHLLRRIDRYGPQGGGADFWNGGRGPEGLEPAPGWSDPGAVRALVEQLDTAGVQVLHCLYPARLSVD